MKLSTLFAVLSYSITAFAQQQYRDSLLIVLPTTKQDTARIELLARLSQTYVNTNPDSEFLFANQGLKLSQSIGYKKGELRFKDILANYWWAVGDYATSIKLLLPVRDFYKSQMDTLGVASTEMGLGNSYRDHGDYKDALHCYFIYLEMTQRYDPGSIGIADATIGSVYYQMNEIDSVRNFANRK